MDEEAVQKMPCGRKRPRTRDQCCSRRGVDTQSILTIPVLQLAGSRHAAAPYAHDVHAPMGNLTDIWRADDRVVLALRYARVLLRPSGSAV